jgi:hypothetical protein
LNSGSSASSSDGTKSTGSSYSSGSKSSGSIKSSNDNIDILTFNYQRVDEYVSRACGYKTLFTLNSTNPITVTPDSDNWIQSVVVSQPNIENENETHIKIYF